MCSKVAAMKGNTDAAGNNRPCELSKPLAPFGVTAEDYGFIRCDFRAHIYEEAVGRTDGSHKSMQMSWPFCTDKHVVSSNARCATSIKDNKQPRAEQERNNGHAQWAPLGNAIRSAIGFS